MIEKEQKTTESCLSTTTDEQVDVQALNSLISCENSVFDRIFPFLNEMFKIVRLPDFIYLLLLIWVLLELLSLSMWNDIVPAIKFDSLINGVDDKVTEIFLFISPNFRKNNFLIPLIIFTIMTGIEIFVVIFQTIYYQIYRRLLTWSLYITRFVLEIFSIIMIAQLSYNIGAITLIMFQSNIQTAQIVTLCAFVFFLVVNIFFLYIAFV
jgi:hypothetical protein